MDVEAWSLHCELDSVPIAVVANELHDLLLTQIDAALPLKERIPASILSPLLARVRRDLSSPGIFYALFASRRHFRHQMKSDPGWARLWSTRAAVCESLAIRLIGDFSDGDALAQNLVYQFFPLADGEINRPDNVSTPPKSLRVSALELAIASHASKFISHPLVVKIVSELYNGHLILDPQINKAHRAHDSAALKAVLASRRGIVARYNFESASPSKPSRLRVPKYRYVLKLLSVTILALLYIATMGSTMNDNGELSISWLEPVFSIWGVAFVLDELATLKAAGRKLYFVTLWSILDFTTCLLYICFWSLRLAAILAGSRQQSQALNVWAYDILAASGITLVPRVFNVLEVSEGFARTVISVRKMVIELIWCWLAIGMFSVGFWAALAHYGKGVFNRSKVFYDLFQVMFGFTPAVWQSWREYPSWLGSGVLFVYLFMAQFVISTMVIASLSARYSETINNSLEEYHFLNAVKTQLKINSERQILFYYIEPLNLVGYLVTSVSYSVPLPSTVRLNRFILKLTHFPIFLGIYAYERITAAWILHNKNITEEQSRRLQKHVRQRDRNWNPSDTIGRNAGINLVEEALTIRPDTHQSHQNPSWRQRRYSTASDSVFGGRQFSVNSEEDPAEILRELRDNQLRLEEMIEEISRRLSR